MLVIVLIVIITVVLLIGMDRVSGQHTTDGRRRKAVDDRILNRLYTVGLSAARNRSPDIQGFPRLSPNLQHHAKTTCGTRVYVETKTIGMSQQKYGMDNCTPSNRNPP